MHITCFSVCFVFNIHVYPLGTFLLVLLFFSLSLSFFLPNDWSGNMADGSVYRFIGFPIA